MAAVASAASTLPDRADAVIVGGGASGLALARQLAAGAWRDRDVLIVDDGSHGLTDRAWAYWSDPPGLVDPAVSASFDRFWVRTHELDHLVVLTSRRYRVVRGPDLDRAADAAVATAPGFRRVRGRVSQIGDGRREASVVVAGRTVRADWVFDSVGVPGRGDPPAAAARATRPASSLAFVGRRIETEVDTFDATAPTLMDFRTRQDGDLSFVYVLPASPRVALVEHTRFTADPAPSTRPGEEAVDAYLSDVLGVGTHRVLDAEHGQIALGSPPGRRPGHRVVPIGARAGMVKPSTGYGYARIQRHSAALARSLAAHGHPFDVPAPPARFRVIDDLMLEAIRREPARVIEVFERLFTANPGDRVLAFLDEGTTIAQELAVIRTLPPGPFLRALRTVRARPAPR